MAVSQWSARLPLLSGVHIPRRAVPAHTARCRIAAPPPLKASHSQTVYMTAAATAEAHTEAQVEKLDAQLAGLSAHKGEWGAAAVENKVAVLKEVRARLLDNAVAWAQAARDIRGKAGKDDAAPELFANVVLATAAIDGYIASLAAFTTTDQFPQLPVRETQDGRTVAKVFPQGFREKYLSLLGPSGVSAELYIQPGQPASQGAYYRAGREGGARGGQVAVLLGAGNQGFLALGDVLHMVVVEGCVVLLKHHPIQAPAAQFIDYVFEPLARRGFFASTICDLPATQHLLRSPLVDRVHMTGGAATHDAIVWGPPGPEQERRKAANDPVLKVPISSELGCVTPWIVVPGPWDEKQLAHHAAGVAAGVYENVSCNCLSPKILLLAEGWDQADAFIQKVREELAACPLPPPYYPGIHARYQAFKQQYPGAEAIHAPALRPEWRGEGPPLPWLLNVLPGYPAQPQEESAFRNEPFAPVLTVVKVPTPDSGKPLPVAFLEAATRGANEDLWGTLSCTLIVHPDTEARHPAAVVRALDELRYGSVCVNSFSVIGYTVVQAMWGAHGGSHTLQDIGSGIGHVHNVYLFDHPQKAVVRTPFVSALHPQPPGKARLSLSTAKVVAGLVHSGLSGMLKLLRQ